MKEANDQLIKSFLERTFFKAWTNRRYLKEPNRFQNYSRLEVQVNALCDLNCKYCYYDRFKKDLYPAKISNPKLILNNLNILLEWLTKNSYYPQIEVFSGELFFQEIGFQVVDIILNWYIKNDLKGNNIIIPTNYSFLFDNEKTERVEKIIKRANENHIRIYLSASVDGKYCDSNRPFKDGKIRDDEYYEKMFEFSKKYNYGFHPMVYGQEIENWKKNWLWFQENMKKHLIHFSNMYLLEVRNAEWTSKQLKEFYSFIRFVVRWAYENSNVKDSDFPQFVYDKKLFNLFSMFASVGRGVGCSVQAAVQLRLGDLTTSVCHRTSYKPHNLWKFLVQNNEIVDIESLNFNLAIAVASMDSKNLPYCEYCSIKEFCSGQCLGAMYETNGDPFLPIPTVCALEHAKASAILDELQELGIWQYFYDWSSKKQSSLKLYYEYFQGAK